MSINKEYSFIFETTQVVPNEQLEIITESTTRDKKPKVKFKTKLQEANVVNLNNRRYSTQICESIVKQLTNRANSNTLLSELNHPFNLSDSNMKSRVATIDINNCCAKINNIKLNDNFIIGEMTTLSAFKGPDLARLIIEDKVDIGFSLRALGSVKQLSEGVLEVAAPIRPITFDVVDNPSHQNAKIIEFLPERDGSALQSAQVLLVEGQEIELLQDDVSVSNNFGIDNFINDIIAENLRNIVSKKIIFKI